MYLLDTTHCLSLIWGLIEEELSSLGKASISTCVISYGELIFGAYKSERVRDRLRRRGFKIESLGFKDNDLWIASVAIQHDLILVSADSDAVCLSGIEGLKVENW